MAHRKKPWIAIAGGVAAIPVVIVAGLVVNAMVSAEKLLAHPSAPYPQLAASTDPAVIARGKYLVHGPAHCSQCHSVDDRNQPEKVRTAPLSGGLAFAMGPLGTRYAANLTSDPKTGIGGRTDAELARTIRTGVLRTGELSFFMRFAVSELSDEDLVAVISYLRSLPPVEKPVPPGEWYLPGKLLLTYAFPPLLPKPVAGPAHVPPSDEPSVERGRYLSDHVMLCTMCHTAIDQATFAPVGPKAGGSLPDPSHGDDTDMEFVAPNLTSHATGRTGAMDEAAFLERFRSGRVFKSSIMPWESFQDVTDADLRSVYRYLRSLPAVDNDVGPTYRKAGWTKG